MQMQAMQQSLDFKIASFEQKLTTMMSQLTENFTFSRLSKIIGDYSLEELPELFEKVRRLREHPLWNISDIIATHDMLERILHEQLKKNIQGKFAQFETYFRQYFSSMESKIAHCTQRNYQPPDGPVRSQLVDQRVDVLLRDVPQLQKLFARKISEQSATIESLVKRIQALEIQGKEV